MLAVWEGDLHTSGKKKIKILSKYYHESVRLDPNAFYLPCGKCIGCRLDYARKWSDRMILELDHSKKACFITLTYNDENLPEPVINENTGEVCYPLVKSHVSEFMKRLRSRSPFDDLDFHQELRFFASGEYGPLHHRPHYHMILFGTDCEELNGISDLRVSGKNELKQLYFDSEFLDDVWKKGFVQVSDASYDTMNYVARYTAKKAQGDTYAADNGIQEEFSLMSRNPGIGSFYAKEHADEIRNLKVHYVTPEKKIFWPSYLIEKVFSEEELQKIKESRKEDAIEKIEQQLKQSDLEHQEQLKVALTLKEKSIKMLSSRQDL